MIVPVGFRFSPTEEEMIRCFLFPKVMGHPLPWDGVRERCVYKAEPWNVFDGEETESWQTKKEGGSVKKTIYVFTSITPNAKDSKRAARIAGCGTWSGQTGPKDITHSDTGETIGYSRMLTFKIKKDSISASADKFNDQDSSSLGHWIMHEYSLSDSTLRMAGLTHNHIVLCKITTIIKIKNKNNKSPQIHQTAAAAIEEVQYYSPQTNINNTNTNTAGEGESYCTTTTTTTTAIEDQIQQQTAAAEDKVQYYFPENNSAAEGDDHDHVNNNNKRSRGAQEEDVLFEMQHQHQYQQQGGACKKQKSSSTDDQIDENIYDLPYLDFGDIEICSHLPYVDFNHDIDIASLLN